MSYRMTNEAMREAIARSVGWKRLSIVEHADGNEVAGENPTNSVRTYIPNYPADLNAIREAVCALPIDLQDQFNDRIAIQLWGRGFHRLDAADWCRVFCRTVPCGCGCGLTIWECYERKAKEGGK